MKIRNAELCDLPYLLEMLENAKASLRALGIDQWQNGYPNETTLREDIQNRMSEAPASVLSCSPGPVSVVRYFRTFS